jgi:hypothetical protein
VHALVSVCSVSSQAEQATHAAMPLYAVKSPASHSSQPLPRRRVGKAAQRPEARALALAGQGALAGSGRGWGRQRGRTRLPRRR